MECINSSLFNKEETNRRKQEFRKNQPYPHVLLDNFLSPECADKIAEHFPSTEKLAKHYKGLNEQKSEGSNFQDFDPVFAELRNELRSDKFYKWISEVTGIENLSITDDNLGAGLHQGKNGSFLDVHIDFNIHVKRNVHRRLNLLIYLQKGWVEEYGGKLEMWNADMTKCEKAVLPEFNRCVIFETSDISYHGYSKITIPENITRKSFYAYFYTPLGDEKLKYHDTVFKTRPEEGKMKKIQTTVKENLKNNIKAGLKKLGITLD